ncbi:MAG: hypothetical protein JO010_03150, partial [Alphaproteobacteria bacterium]|nr:hypothetical protein [Alphaproteobacteria bacterium]
MSPGSPAQRIAGLSGALAPRGRARLSEGDAASRAEHGSPLSFLAPILEHMPAFFIADPSGAVLYANRPFDALSARFAGTSEPSPFPWPAPPAEIIAEIASSGAPITRDLSLAGSPPCQLRVHFSAIGSPEGGQDAILARFEDLSALGAARHQL